MIWIIVDNLRVGGIERLALDQMYQLSDNNMRAKLLVLDKKSTFENGNFWQNEQSDIFEKQLNIHFCSQPKHKLVSEFIGFLLADRPTLIIDYTLKSTPILRFLVSVFRVKTRIHCVIQQLPSLSNAGQRYRRMFYSQFSNKLFINSVYYSKDWKSYQSKNFITKVLFRKSHLILRNGVYFGRLQPSASGNFLTKLESENEITRFVFLGRLKSWKGLDRLDLLDKVSVRNCEFLIITPTRDKVLESQLIESFGERVSFLVGKSVQQFEPHERDIHVYGVNYGSSVKYPESVATNCLEMAILGVPSLVTKGGTQNWPELDNLNLIYEVNWDDEGEVAQVIARVKGIKSKRNITEQFQRAVNVQRNLDEHLNELS